MFLRFKSRFQCTLHNTGAHPPVVHLTFQEGDTFEIEHGPWHPRYRCVLLVDEDGQFPYQQYTINPRSMMRMLQHAEEIEEPQKLTPHKQLMK